MVIAELDPFAPSILVLRGLLGARSGGFSPAQRIQRISTGGGATNHGMEGESPQEAVTYARRVNGRVLNNSTRFQVWHRATRRVPLRLRPSGGNFISAQLGTPS